MNQSEIIQMNRTAAEIYVASGLNPEVKKAVRQMVANQVDIHNMNCSIRCGDKEIPHASVDKHFRIVVAEIMTRNYEAAKCKVREQS